MATMKTEIHDSTTCTAGIDGQPCEMCQFAQESTGNHSKLPSEALWDRNWQMKPLALEAKNVSEGLLTQTTAIPAPNFEREWKSAAKSHKRYTEKAEAKWWLMRGVWLGVQYERERGLLAMNGDLKEMQRIARERIER